MMTTETKATFWNTEPHTPQAAEFHGQILNSHNERFPMQSDDPNVYKYIVVTTVLVAGAVGDYACYQAVGDPDWVKEHGNKLTFREAQEHFMGLEERRYRR